MVGFAVVIADTSAILYILLINSNGISVFSSNCKEAAKCSWVRIV